jgi:hypothetical protein
MRHSQVIRAVSFPQLQPKQLQPLNLLGLRRDKTCGNLKKPYQADNEVGGLHKSVCERGNLKEDVDSRFCILIVAGGWTLN